MDDLIGRGEALEAIKWLPVQLDAETVQRCIEAVSNLPSAQQWVPCSDKLPNETGAYLVTNNNFVCPVELAMFFADGSYWTDAYIGTRYKDSYILAWMPLPKPYEVKQ